MSEALFDLPALPDKPVLSRDQRLTVRRQEMLAAGKHPLRGDALTPVTGATCGNCKHVVARGHNLRTYWKCGLIRSQITAGSATDLRVGWPGCSRWESA